MKWKEVRIKAAYVSSTTTEVAGKGLPRRRPSFSHKQQGEVLLD
jgi:hypothetical protein